MAMFELEDSKGVELENCHTTSGTLVSGKNLDDLKAKECKAGYGPLESPPKIQPAVSRFQKALRFIISQSWLFLTGTVVTVVGGILLFKLKMS